MYYYRQKGEYIIKYSVTINSDSLNELRTKIIEKCSYITHKYYKTTKNLNDIDLEHIKNYQEKKIGIIEYNDFYSSSEDEYLVEYDYYHHPNLVSWIDELLNGNTNAIEKIENMQDEMVFDETKFIEEQRKIIEELSNIKNDDITKKIELLETNQKKLLNFYKERELNKEQISAIQFQKKVLNCLELFEVDIIPLKTILEVKSFFNNSSELVMEKNLNKLLKLEKRKQP